MQLPLMPSGGAPEEKTKLPGAELRFYVWILAKRRSLIAAIVLIFLLSSIIYTKSQKDIYEAKAIVRLDPFAAQAIPGVAPGAPRPMSFSINTAAQLIKTNIIAERAARWLKRTEPSLQVSAEEIFGAITATPVEPDFVHIVVRHGDPNRARLIANAVAHAFEEWSNEDARREASRERETIERELRRFEDKLGESEQSIARFSQSKTLQQNLPLVDLESQVGFLLNTVNGYVNQLRSLETDEQALRAQLDEARSRYQKAAPFEEVPTINDNPFFAKLSSRLFELQIQRIELESRYHPDAPEIQDIDDEIETLKKKLQDGVPPKEKGTSLERNPLREQFRQRILDLSIRLTELQARKRALTTLISHTSARLQQVPELRRNFQQLKRLQQALEKVYTILLERRIDAMIKENAKMGSVHIADLAPQNLRPINPPPSRLISIGVFLGLLFGVALAILLELLDTTVATPDDVRASLSLTTLGSVPRLTHKPPLQGADFVSFMRTKHPYAEAFRTLRSHLKFLRSDRPFKTLLFTSTRAGEGKTQVTGSLGVVLALAGHKVILVDADLRHPSMHRLFDVPNARGLTHALVGDADVASCLSQTPIPNLFLMTAGAIPPNPAELLEGERISHVLKAVSEQADFVLIDSPPALIVTDATILAGRTDVVDGVILVIESAKVPREAVQRSKEMIERAKGNLCGVILNKISLKHGRSYYYYHYYYYPYYGGEGDQMKQQVPS